MLHKFHRHIVTSLHFFNFTIRFNKSQDVKLHDSTYVVDQRFQKTDSLYDYIYFIIR